MLRKCGYNEGIHDGLRLESVALMVLFPANNLLTQGSLHYRLATLGYQKRNTYGVEEYYSSYNLRHFMQPSASFHRSICVISSHKTRLITRPFASIHFVFYYQQWCHH